jgi:phosphoribosylaminoimidazole-succinocarboxamide synthase
VAGSAWAEYKKTQTVHGMPMPAGLVESQKFPEPIFTPSTKAPKGQHDENISPEQGPFHPLLATISQVDLSLQLRSF